MNFIQFAERIIREKNRPLTSNEIWEIGLQQGYDKELNSKGKTPWATIGARLYRDIKENPSTPFIKLNVKPAKYYLKTLSQNYNMINIETEEENSIVKNETRYDERDLHKFLSYYVSVYHSVYTKTIFHESSSKKNYGSNKWVHPDIVGVSFSFEKWEPETFDISKEVGNLAIKFYSYELKKKLNFSNLRESFFQTVSNSSWANEGYLVTAEIEKDDEFENVIQRLSNSFGIGLIKLDIDDPDSSSIICPAKPKEIIDIDAIDAIAEINPDFKDFLRRVKTDLTTKDIIRERYDKILEAEDLISSIKKLL